MRTERRSSIIMAAAEGEQLAGLVRRQLVQDLIGEPPADEAQRQLLSFEKTKGTIVIVECGFLSNAAEAGKLCDEAYQRQSGMVDPQRNFTVH